MIAVRIVSLSSSSAMYAEASVVDSVLLLLSALVLLLVLLQVLCSSGCVATVLGFTACACLVILTVTQMLKSTTIVSLTFAAANIMLQQLQLTSCCSSCS
jgi:hypothetical protein